MYVDKNRDRLEEATQEFAYLQQCYTVLSDPHERKWYDNHRDAILRSGPSSAKDSSSGSYTDEDGDSYFDLMPFFNSSAYKGFNDGPKVTSCEE